VTPAKPIRLYRHALSGHAHRVELFLSLLGLPCELIAVDMVRGAHKASDFIAKNNPFGQVPVIEDGDVAIADSNAIPVYLATRYDSTGHWLPRDAVAAARVQQWLSVAAGQLAYGPSMARLAVVFGARLDLDRDPKPTFGASPLRCINYRVVHVGPRTVRPVPRTQAHIKS